MLSLAFFVYTGTTGQARGQFLSTEVLLGCVSSDKINETSSSPSPRTIQWIILPFSLSISLIFPILLGNKVNASCPILVISQVRSSGVYKYNSGAAGAVLYFQVKS